MEYRLFILAESIITYMILRMYWDNPVKDVLGYLIDLPKRIVLWHLGCFLKRKGWVKYDDGFVVGWINNKRLMNGDKLVFSTVDAYLKQIELDLGK